MSTKVKVIYHKHANRQTIDELVAQYGSGLIAGIEANRKLGRAEEAFLHSGGHLLVVGTRRLAFRLGVTVGGDVEYFVYGMPLDCEMARSLRDHIKADPACVAVDGDNIQ